MRELFFFIAMSVILLAIIPFYLFQGAVDVRWEDVFGSGLTPGIENPYAKQVFWEIRMPRLVLAMLCGSGLALGGALVQGIFRNPLVEPGLIGISSGAALFASASIVFFDKWVNQLYVLQGFSFVGALLTSLLIYIFSIKNGKISVITLLLMGIGINSGIGALMGLLHYIASDTQLRVIAFWGLGSLAGASWDQILSLLPFYVILLISLHYFAGGLNAFLLGEREAQHLGYNIERLKLLVIIVVCLCVGAIVSVTGVIGFIGLVVPHITRILGRANHFFLLPASALLGGILLLGSDYLARILVSPSELPIGILTAGIGAPVFLYILCNSLKEEG